MRHLYETITAEKMREVFPNTEAVIYGEGYGAGIQKGGDYSPTKKFIVFDVLVGGKWWLSWENTCDVARKLNLEVVPYVGDMTLDDATAMVRAGFPSLLGEGKMRAEGLVGRTEAQGFHPVPAEAPGPKWVVHVVGPDDVIEQPDELTALRFANETNRHVELARREHANNLNWPYCIAIVRKADDPDATPAESE